MELSQVSRTAILLLICRAVLSRKDNANFNDPQSELCLERLMSLASEDDKRWIARHKRRYEGLGARDARAGVLRGKTFDRIADRFITGHPDGTVINLACGFDTRFWRIRNEKCRYIELDLPPVIELKKELLKGHPGYEMIAGSVLDTSWIEQVTATGSSDFLLIAEGLIMWLPPGEAARFLNEIGEKFTRSQLVMDVVHERFTRGLWKTFIRLHSKIEWGLDVAWTFGIRDARQLETYSDKFKVTGEEKGSAGPIFTVSINAAW
jgi:O-methyltransferase involved in polyketide biosynthesis